MLKAPEQKLAEDIGAVEDFAAWPISCIDWDFAAKELQHDYAEIDLLGVSYWIRCG